MMLRKFLALGLGLALTLVLGCGQSAAATAKSTLVNTQGQKVGEATLTETARGGKDRDAGRDCHPGSTPSISTKKASVRVPIFRPPGATLILPASITA